MRGQCDQGILTTTAAVRRSSNALDQDTWKAVLSIPHVGRFESDGHATVHAAEQALSALKDKHIPESKSPDGFSEQQRKDISQALDKRGVAVLKFKPAPVDLAVAYGEGRPE